MEKEAGEEVWGKPHRRRTKAREREIKSLIWLSRRRIFSFKEAPFDSHVIEGDTNASPRLTALCMLRARQLEKPGNVLPPLSGAAGFEPQPPCRRACAPTN